MDAQRRYTSPYSPATALDFSVLPQAQPHAVVSLSEAGGQTSLDNDTREALAAVSHDIWSHWMLYQFSVGQKQPDGSWVMPADKVERWTRQMHAPYAQLTDKEKDSDREQADKIIGVLSGKE